MCLIVFAWKMVPGNALVLAANRDEFFERPSVPANWWNDHPNVYAGRDLEGGGTWLGISRDGRVAAVTNIRSPDERKAHAPSRGALVADYLAQNWSPADYVEHVQAHANAYNGFNLLVGDRHTLICYNNRDHENERNGQALMPGIYGLSNDTLDAPWPKVVRTKAQFASLLCQGAPEEAYFEMLTCTARASDCRLPRTGVSLEVERMLSAVCIQSPDYGTRVSTVVTLPDHSEPRLIERAVEHHPD